MVPVGFKLINVKLFKSFIIKNTKTKIWKLKLHEKLSLEATLLHLKKKIQKIVYTGVITISLFDVELNCF